MNKYSLDQCEQEKLHLSGAIQSHGTLLVVNSQNIITHVAKNITDFLPSSSNCQLNQVLPDPFLALTQPLEKKVGSKTIHSAVIEGKDGIALDLVISCNTLLQITLELIPHKPGPYLLSPLIPNTHKFLNSDNSVQEPQDLVQKIYELIKFDRVLYYQFQDQGRPAYQINMETCKSWICRRLEIQYHTQWHAARRNCITDLCQYLLA